MIDLELNLKAYKHHIMENILILCNNHFDASSTNGRYIYYNVVNRFIKASSGEVGAMFGLDRAGVKRYLKLSVLNERRVDMIVEDIKEPIYKILSRFNSLLTV